MKDFETYLSEEKKLKENTVSGYTNDVASYSVYYSHNIKGSIYDLLMYKSGLNFANTHKKIVSILGDSTFNTTPKKQLFGGIYRQFMPAYEQTYKTVPMTSSLLDPP